MNILFVLYESFESNSAVHVHYLANNLASLGTECVVAVPYGPDSSQGLTPQAYQPIHFSDRGALQRLFEAEGPWIVHAWTPREIVRRYCARLPTTRRFRLIVHLEDNEDAILERYFARHRPSPWKTLRRRLGMIPETLSHPSRFRQFLNAAQGISIIVGALREFVPVHTPWTLFTPGVDTGLFYARGSSRQWKAKLGLPEDRFLLGYSGNVNWANATEVASVYQAAEWLTKNGTPTSVLRTGRNLVPFPWPRSYPGAAGPLELGYVEYHQLPEILACADVLVQPGKPDRFNNYRLPSKIPEYLAMGKPVILPRANIGELLKDGTEAMVLPTVDTESIVRAATKVSQDDELSRALGRGAMDFAVRHFDWRRSADGMLHFYEGLV